MSIVVGHAHTPEGHAALERAVGEARLRSAELRVLRVLRQPTTDDPTQHRDWTAAVEQARRDAAHVEQTLRAQGVAAGVEVIVTSSRTVGEVLLEAGGASDVDLLVIGLRRRSRVGKLLMGSVAQEILLQAEVPVLAVKPAA